MSENIHLQPFPKAPRTSIYVVLRRTITGGLIHGILPYVDIPHREIKKEKFAFILASGLRGTITKKMIEGETKPCTLEEATELDLALRAQQWEPIYISYEDIDMDKHFELRTDDGEYDKLSASLFENLNAWTSCSYCGHANEANKEVCEACKSPLSEGQEPIIRLDLKQTGFNFKGDFS
tara:strand:+ start:936 stop:1472 length:537 start_codon:yes stop_codon:yes gene_type:complete